ncbi:hypothetical protein LMG19146_04051 [Xanthomonas arboricola pv. fragariae]|uniref:hypothetical protein n=1 Tax=Xanthomonas arboricola TaxID=56448 RepID=UPI000CBFA925|nr:hypothetical protein [Xanthomonas arboricola]SOU05120.1 hypothetical protein LMG19146_04051 [Xanthomonas arboricola pv. fragariae]
MKITDTNLINRTWFIKWASLAFLAFFSLFSNAAKATSETNCDNQSSDPNCSQAAAQEWEYRANGVLFRTESEAYEAMVASYELGTRFTLLHDFKVQSPSVESKEFRFCYSGLLDSFCDERDWRTGYYRIRLSKCPSDSPCADSVSQLESSSKGPLDPRRLFHAQQTCIAKRSCELRCNMDNCQWMDSVIPGFSKPYLNGEGIWPAVEASCEVVHAALLGMIAGKWIADRECFATMGWYHVRVDLRAALEKYGCGSEADWALVGRQIEPCLRDTQPGYPSAYYELGGIFVHAERDKVRSQCLAARNSLGLPFEINDNIRGKTCPVAF